VFLARERGDESSLVVVFSIVRALCQVAKGFLEPFGAAYKS
jgi:hypothetical protein